MSDVIDDLGELLSDLHRPTPYPARTELFHYTGPDGLLGILKSGEVHATHYRFLNDREEMLGAEKIILGVAQRLQQAPDVSQVWRNLMADFVRRYPTISMTKVVEAYVASFTTKGNVLSQWRAYGASGAGYSLGFTDLHLPTSHPADHVAAVDVLAIDLHECEYDGASFAATVEATFRTVLIAFDQVCPTTDRARLPELGREVQRHLFRSVARLVPRLKHGAFIEEREWRLVALLVDPGRGNFKVTPTRGLVPYVAIPIARKGDRMTLSKVWVGSTVDPEAGTAAAKGLLTSNGYSNREQLVEWSGIPLW